MVETFREMLSIARDAARQYPEMNQIYLDCSSQSLVSLSEQLSRDAEAVTVELYAQILTEDQEKGRVREDLDIAAVAFMLDNLVMMYQFPLCRIIIWSGKSFSLEECFPMMRKRLLMRWWILSGVQ